MVSKSVVFYYESMFCLEILTILTLVVSPKMEGLYVQEGGCIDASQFIWFFLEFKLVEDIVVIRLGGLGCSRLVCFYKGRRE